VAFLVTLAITAISIIVAHMFQTPVASQLKNQILAGAAAQNHVPVSTVAKFVTFRGDLSYANGLSVLSMALHITAWTALFGMLFGVLGGYVCQRCRRSPGRRGPGRRGPGRRGLGRVTGGPHPRAPVDRLTLTGIVAVPIVICATS
jgi:hypothetical protein